MTLPITTCPMASLATPLRSMAAFTTVVASWVLGTSFSAPPKVPMAVRAVPTTKMSRWVMESSWTPRRGCSVDPRAGELDDLAPFVQLAHDEVGILRLRHQQWLD